MRYITFMGSEASIGDVAIGLNMLFTSPLGQTMTLISLNIQFDQGLGLFIGTVTIKV